MVISLQMQKILEYEQESIPFKGNTNEFKIAYVRLLVTTHCGVEVSFLVMSVSATGTYRTKTLVLLTVCLRRGDKSCPCLSDSHFPQKKPLAQNFNPERGFVLLELSEVDKRGGAGARKGQVQPCSLNVGVTMRGALFCQAAESHHLNWYGGNLKSLERDWYNTEGKISNCNSWMKLLAVLV